MSNELVPLSFDASSAPYDAGASVPDAGQYKFNGRMEVAISPEQAKTNDKLTCVISSGLTVTDQGNEEPVTEYIYQFIRTGDAIPQESSDGVLSSSDTRRGDQWKCVVRGIYKGTESGSQETNAVTIGNSPPNTGQPSISVIGPASSVDASFRCIPSTDWFDADDDSQEPSNFRWFVNNLPEPTTSASVDVFLGRDLQRGDELVCEVTPSDGSAQGPPVRSEILSITNAIPSITRTSITPGAGGEETSFRCEGDSQTWNDSDGDLAGYKYRWFVTTGTITSSMVVSSTITGSHFNRDDQIRCEVTPDDGQGGLGAAVSTATITIENTAPSMGSVAVTPASGTEETTFTCAGQSWSDVDGDPPNYNYQWYVSQSPSVTTPDITGNNFNKGDSIYCVATPVDARGHNGLSGRTATITIANTLPTAPSVAIEPAYGKPEESLRCIIAAEATDIDPNDNLTYTLIWSNQRGISVQVSTQSRDYVHITNAWWHIQEGDTWSCEAYANDGEDNGPRSSAVSIDINDLAYSGPTALYFNRQEVTATEFKKCINAGPCSSQNYTTNVNSVYCTLYGSDEELPMNCVDWMGASDYCAWAGGRLPTESEWKKEAKGVSDWEYPWGDSPEPNCDYCVMSEVSEGCGTGDVFEGCSKELGNSVSGLCDMAGNVSEWTSSPSSAVMGAYTVLGGSYANSHGSISPFSNYVELYVSLASQSRRQGIRCVYELNDGISEPRCSATEAYGESCWPIMPTNIATCYNEAGSTIACPDNCPGTDFCGQDGEYSDRFRNDFTCFTQSMSGTDCSLVEIGSNSITARDNLTGLTWTHLGTRSASDYISWQDAKTACLNHSDANFSDWRLPSAHEMRSTIIFGQTSPPLPSFFPDPDVHREIWTNSEDAAEPDKAFIFYISSRDPFYPSGGSENVLSKMSLRPAPYCVRGPTSTPEPGRYSWSFLQSERLVKDELTQLIWTNANPNPGSWSTALAFCDTSSTSGFTDWRLPNVNELSSVRDYSASNYYSIPLSTLNGTYWTSTSDADVTARAWTVGFGLSNKTIEPITKTESHDIFCVR